MSDSRGWLVLCKSYTYLRRPILHRRSYVTNGSEYWLLWLRRLLILRSGVNLSAPQSACFLPLLSVLMALVVTFLLEARPPYGTTLVTEIDAVVSRSGMIRYDFNKMSVI